MLNVKVTINLLELLHYLQLTKDYLSWLVYLLLNSLYNEARRVVWCCDGTHKLLRQARHARNYRRSAHVKRIVYRHRLDDFITADERDFVTVHEGFINPDELLEDDFSLYSFTSTDAVFVKSKKGRQKRVHEYDFYILGQFYHAEKVVTLPLSQFHVLAEKLADDKKELVDGSKLIVVQNQARCGGTLLTSVFRESGRCITFNEPHSYTVLCKMIFADNKYHGDEAKRMYTNVTRVICKPRKFLDEPVLAYVIKPTVINIIAVRLHQEAFPDSQQLFMYRDARAVAVSLRRLGQMLNSLKLMFYLPNIPRCPSFLVNLIGYANTDFRCWTPKKHPNLEFGFYCASLSMHHYLSAVKHGVKIRGVRYSDLIAHRGKLIRQFFEICELPQSLVERGEQALNKDSQGNSKISQESLRKFFPNPPKVTDNILPAFRLISKRWGTPDPEAWNDKTFRLKHSIVP